jgi:hypothetical protein
MRSVLHQGHNSFTEIGTGGMAYVANGALVFLVAIMTYSVVNLDYFFKCLSFYSPASEMNAVKLRIPLGLDHTTRRELSLNLGGGKCLWQVRYTRNSHD